MKFYGVGTRFDGNEPFFEDCYKYDFWCMGDEEEKYIDLYHSIEIGDILVAKKGGMAFMDIEAVGIVTSLDMPDNVPSRYTSSDKYGVSVVWIEVFSEPIRLTSKDYRLGDTKPRTIFNMSYEKDKPMISKVLEIIKYK